MTADNEFAKIARGAKRGWSMANLNAASAGGLQPGSQAFDSELEQRASTEDIVNKEVDFEDDDGKQTSGSQALLPCPDPLTGTYALLYQLRRTSDRPQQWL